MHRTGPAGGQSITMRKEPPPIPVVRSAPAGRRLQRTQRGAALLIFLVLLVTAALTYLVDSLTPEAVEARRINKTGGSLAGARDALIGYALQYRDQQAAQNPSVPYAMYGYLPLPDFGKSVNLNHNLVNQPCTTEGCAMINPANLPAGIAIGRFPWKTVGTDALRDGNQECLWYAVSTSHRSINSTATVMNWDALASPDIVIGSGQPDLSTVGAHERPIAVIFSPGPAFDGSRTQSTDAPICGGNYIATNYLNPALNNAQHSIAITSKMLFDALRNHAYFRTDINSLLDRTVSCLRDEIAAGGILPGGKISGADTNACYGSAVHPLGYYPHYREMIFVAAPANVNGAPCAGALLFAGQRGTKHPMPTDPLESLVQLRTSAAVSANNPTQHHDWQQNYFEDTNLLSLTSGTNSFTGPDRFDRISTTQTAEQDIVRCIPFGASLNQVVSPALNALGGQLTSYDAANRILTLGRLNPTLTTTQRTANAAAFFGCSWTPEDRLLGSGLRSYFKFRIQDTGGGFTFAIVDGERNTANVCGATSHHLGYSGNNGDTTPISFPKIGIEIDTRQQSTRNDPAYTGGHFGIVYWGGEITADDDNAHSLPTSLPALRPPPRNPVAPATPTLGAGVYKLDASLSQIPVNQDIHVRIELSRTATDAAERSKTWLLEVWLLKDSATDAARITAMKNTTRPMLQLAPAFAAQVRDTPRIYDVQGGSCAGGNPCPTGQTCSSSDNMCYAEALRTARLGFTTSQSTAASDQIINITDFFTTWLP